MWDTLSCKDSWVDLGVRCGSQCVYDANGSPPLVSGIEALSKDY